ncbi:hypothetical protein [Haloarcula halophila]|uniref:hypothetical protein n=1 Tax=Haloarcula TaxID=2237 RepID=UPI0023E3DE44|nr:hypothetical protein [Halomicroarcula sp. DFY41]
MTATDRVTLVGGAAVALTVAALGGVVALGVLEVASAIRAGYAVIAAVVALALYVLTRGDGTPAGSPPITAAQTAKLVVVLGAVAVAVTAWTGNRLAALLVVLPAGYLLVGTQVRHDGAPVPTLVATTVLFAVPPISKHLTTGFYFGGTDTFAHVDSLNRLFAAGYTTVLPHGYDFFPGFHLFVGAASLLGGLSPYDALVWVGIGVSALLVPTMYLVATRLFEGTRLALGVALAVTAVEWVGYHAVYFFPQTLAVVLLGVGFYVATSLSTAGTTRRYRRYGAYTLGLVVVLVSVHHLTYVVALVPVGAVAAVTYAVPFVAGRVDHPALQPLADARRRLRFRWSFPVVVVAAAVVSYLVFSGSIIVYGIFGLAFGIGREVAGSGAFSTFLYGVTVPPDTAERALSWFARPTGIYYSLFGAVALVGLYEMLAAGRRYAHRGPLLAVAVGTVPLFLPLPVQIPQVERITVVVVLFAVLPLGIGIARTLGGFGPRAGRTAAVVGLVLVATLGTAGALTTLTADDIEAVDVPDRDVQTAMSDREYAATVETATFIDRYGTQPAASDQITARAFASAPFAGSDQLVRQQQGLRAGPDGLSAPTGYLVVRDSWADSVVPVASGRGLLSSEVAFFAVSESRYRTETARHSVVYSAGETRVIYDGERYDGLFGEGGDSR